MSTGGTGGSLPLILASSSPRRRQLLARAGIRFEVEVPDVPEQQRPGETAAALVERLARAKALAVSRRVGPRPLRWVLGADTVVVLDGEVLGKPRDADHAVSLLRCLAGRPHRVLTGVALAASDGGASRHAVVESRVALRPVAEAELWAYVATGEPLDKAGAYAAQGEGRRFIERIDGSESNVIGLPLDETLQLLRAAGVGPADP